MIVEVRIKISYYAVMEVFLLDIGKRIAYFRTAKDYSVNRLADYAGISQTHLRDVESGAKKPSVEIVSSICEALGISLSEFFDDGTQKKLQSDPLFAWIYKLSPEQRQALYNFVSTLDK